LHYAFLVRCNTRFYWQCMFSNCRRRYSGLTGPAGDVEGESILELLEIISNQCG
jgi:hypothetical protein